MARFALFAGLAACGSDKGSNAGASDAGADARKVRIDAPEDLNRSMVCAPVGTSTVTGSGPDGSLAADHVYARVVTGFCPPQVTLVVTAEESLAWPYLHDSAEISVDIPTSGDDWSGTYTATVARPDGTAAASGTVVVEQAAPQADPASRIRATAQLDDRDWHFTATIDAVFCDVDVCI